MPDLGKAYVQIVPSAQGLRGSIADVLSKEAVAAGDAAGVSAAGRFSGSFGNVLRAVSGPAIAAGIGSILKSTVGSYADYEQLVGGVETMFSNLDGTVSAAPQVLRKANKAYKTAGLSANGYMGIVTGFSAALVSSLNGDYKKAARYADMAATDMADNANKFGTNIRSIQDAYQGFAKQNYTMLDNLKLGYGGSKAELERLLADATELSGVQYDISNLSDVYEAIHIIQEEIGITGTTAEEAEKTISGSFSMAKASLSNLMTGLASGDADVNRLMEEFFSSAGTFAENVVPVVGQALQSIGEAAPELAEQLLDVLADNMPAIIEGGVDMVGGAVEGILHRTLEGVFGEIPDFHEQFQAAAQVDADAIAGTFYESSGPMGEAMRSAMSGAAAAASDGALFIDAGLSATASLQTGASQGMEGQDTFWGDFGRTLATAFGFAVEEETGPVSAKAQAMADGSGDPLEALGGMSGGWGAHMGLNFASALAATAPAAAAAAARVAQAAAIPLKHTVPKEGPLADDDQWGAHLVQNLTKGMADEAPGLRSEAERLAGIVRDGMNFDRRAARGGLRIGRENAADNEAMRGEVRNLAAAIRSMGIYLDTGTLIGAVDQGLGRARAGVERRSLR